MTQTTAFRKGARTIAPSNNPAKNDDIISRWNGKVDTRFNNLKNRITRLVGKNDVFGLSSGATSDAQRTQTNKLDFSRGTDNTRINQFMVWLRNMEKADKIDIIYNTGWADPQIRQNFARGGSVASKDVTALTAGTESGALYTPIGTSGRTLSTFMGQRMSTARIKLAHSRVLNGMRGVTVAMNNQIANVLAEGLTEGIGATAMARRINDRVDKIGITRAKLIARTESNQIYNEGALMEFDNASGMIGETVLSQWWATLDNRVRASHLARHGKVFKREDAMLLIGEPNCRCSLLPYIESIEGEVKLSKASTFTNSIILNMQDEECWAKYDWREVCTCCAA